MDAQDQKDSGQRPPATQLDMILAVARERFVVASFWNGAWGTPTYFVGQVVLALTVG